MHENVSPSLIYSISSHLLGHSAIAETKLCLELRLSTEVKGKNKLGVGSQSM